MCKLSVSWSTTAAASTSSSAASAAECTSAPKLSSLSLEAQQQKVPQRQSSSIKYLKQPQQTKHPASPSQLADTRDRCGIKTFPSDSPSPSLFARVLCPARPHLSPEYFEVSVQCELCHVF